MDTRNYCLASTDPPSVWNLYATPEAAQAHMSDANEYNVKLEKHGAPKRNYIVMTWDEYVRAQREFWLKDPPQAITERKFNEMLEVLPPMKWETGRHFESFLMMEFTSGPYTSQYVRVGELESVGARYYCKTVDATDRSTWMKASDF